MDAPLERKLLAVRLADRIEAAIRDGRWTDKLPGNRTLAERYGVNRKTCAAAVQLLASRGILGPAKSGMRRPILSKKQARKQPVKRSGKRLLIIHTSAPVLSFEDFAILQSFQQTWEQTHGDTSWAAVDYGRCKRPGQLLDALIERHDAHAILMLMPPAGWSTAALERKPSYQLGGISEQSDPVSLTAFALDGEIARAAGELRALGHQRILIPVGFVATRMRDAVLKGLRTGAPKHPPSGTWDDYCPDFPESVPAAWHSYWPKAFAGVRPTAIILLEDFHLLSLYGHCAASGIQIPRDLSVILLSWDPRFEWCQPRPTMLRYPVKASLAHFKSWLAGGMRPLGRKLLPLTAVLGESVARPPSR